jgi:hypothetical protein
LHGGIHLCFDAYVRDYKGGEFQDMFGYSPKTARCCIGFGDREQRPPWGLIIVFRKRKGYDVAINFKFNHGGSFKWGMQTYLEGT